MKKFDSRTIRKTATFHFLDEILHPIIDPEYRSRQIYIAFYDEEGVITSIGAFNSMHFQQMMRIIEEEKPRLDADNGILYVNEFDKFITYF